MRLKGIYWNVVTVRLLNKKTAYKLTKVTEKFRKGNTLMKYTEKRLDKVLNGTFSLLENEHNEEKQLEQLVESYTEFDER